MSRIWATFFFGQAVVCGHNGDVYLIAVDKGHAVHKALCLDQVLNIAFSGNAVDGCGELCGEFGFSSSLSFAFFRALQLIQRFVPRFGADRRAGSKNLSPVDSPTLTQLCLAVVLSPHLAVHGQGVGHHTGGGRGVCLGGLQGKVGALGYSQFRYTATPQRHQG